MREGSKFGEVSEVTVMAAAEESTDAQAYSVGCVSDERYSEQRDRLRRQRVRSMLDTSTLQDPTKKKLLSLLENHHEAFCLNDSDRGETELVEIHIETGEATPKRQRARRMPFTLCVEVTKQLRKTRI